MNLNISKSPQSSAFNVIIDHHLFRIRVSTMPSGAFESLVLRLNHLKFKEPLRNLLLDSDEDVIFKNSVKHRSGLIVITGPTCSGKTTLTYCLLNDLKQMGLSIVTIEDPVEHYEEGFVQLQINENAGINYYSSVKEVLRHDPDVIFIGEIRDELTAKSAIRASLTGHLVISTMHAASCLKAIYRFIELGLTISDLDQTLRLVTNQRLIIHQNFKKIVFEYLDAIMLSDALNCLRKNENYNYQTIENKLNLISDYEVIKE